MELVPFQGLFILSVPGVKDVMRGEPNSSAIVSDISHVEIGENSFTIHRFSDPHHAIASDSAKEDEIALLRKLVAEGTLADKPSERWAELQRDIEIAKKASG